MTRATFTLSLSLLFSFNRTSKVRVTYCTKGSESETARSDPPITVRIPTFSLLGTVVVKSFTGRVLSQILEPVQVSLSPVDGIELTTLVHY